jgi:hypothetical protein
VFSYFLKDQKVSKILKCGFLPNRLLILFDMWNVIVFKAVARKNGPSAVILWRAELAELACAMDASFFQDSFCFIFLI